MCLCHRRYQIVSPYLPLPTLYGLWENAPAVVSFRWTLAGGREWGEKGSLWNFLEQHPALYQKKAALCGRTKRGYRRPLGLAGRPLLPTRSLWLPCVWSRRCCSSRILTEWGLLAWHSMVFCADLETSLGEALMHVKKRLCVKEAVKWSWFQGPGV